MSLFLEYKPRVTDIAQWLRWYANDIDAWKQNNQLANIYPTRVIIANQNGRFRFTEPDGQSVVLDIPVEDARMIEFLYPANYRLIEVSHCDCMIVSRFQPSLTRRRKRK